MHWVRDSEGRMVNLAQCVELSQGRSSYAPGLFVVEVVTSHGARRSLHQSRSLVESKKYFDELEAELLELQSYPVLTTELVGG